MSRIHATCEGRTIICGSFVFWRYRRARWVRIDGIVAIAAIVSIVQPGQELARDGVNAKHLLYMWWELKAVRKFHLWLAR